VTESAAVLFDLDGTLTDSRPGILRSTREAIRRLNEATGEAHPIPEESALNFMIGPPLRESFTKLVGADRAEMLLTLYRERYLPIGMFENAVYDGVPEALEALHSAGYRLYVATSKNEVDARRVLEHFDLAKFFIRVYGSQADGGRAVKAELISYVLDCESIEADPKGVAMVGDRKYDILGAKAVGVCALGALWGYGDRAELGDAGADAIIEAPRGIPATVERVFGRTLAR
jgi:phosphoglycolate phosphatase